LHINTKKDIDGYRKIPREEILLISVIILAGIILGSVILENVLIYKEIPPYWKAAIVTFILLLPVAFFLQAFLNVMAVKHERKVEVQRMFRDMYVAYISESKDSAPLTDEYITDLQIFRRMLDNRCKFLITNQKTELYDIYRQANRIHQTKYLKYPLTIDNVKNLSAVSDVKEQRKNVRTIPSHLIEERRNLLEFELENMLQIIIESQMQAERINYRSFLLPLSFFLFMYFTGFLITLPLINSVFSGESQMKHIPLYGFAIQGQAAIPLLILQWGFIGGLVYTSISLLTRFIRRDLRPNVYFNASFRIIYSVVVAIVIYFMYIFVSRTETVSPYIFLLCFLAGVAPIQILINSADTYMSKIHRGWRRRNVIGYRPVIQIEGIDSITAERLGEEGVDYIHQMAMCNANKIASSTNFPLKIVKDWKDQAILYILTGGIILKTNPNGKKRSLYDILGEKVGIRNITSLINTWKRINEPCEKSDEEQKVFFEALGVLNCEKNLYFLKCVFNNIINEAISMIE
jgi:hypothetical protein